ncbi:MAG TPA: transglycosylase domain-containing protein, partial [Terriglobales bacterium]|nr:transglycosylase domain-containing protein [Terriglobales bacterium]
YTSDLPDMSAVGRFAPSTRVVLPLPCIQRSVTAIPAAQMGAHLRGAIRAVQSSRSVPFSIALSLFCEPDRTHQRQLDELRVYSHLRLRFSDEELLTIFANQLWFGEETNGVQDAAHYYFNKDPRSLTASEAALLVAVAFAPSYYSPTSHPERALKRRNQVLERMVAQGSLTPAQAKAAEAEPLPSFNRH